LIAMPPPKISLETLTVLALAAAAIGLGGCRSAGRFLGNLLKERAPAPLDSMSVASDVRIDSLGYVVGSFVGEGTSRSVHLLSSDTGLVSELTRRYRPDLVESGQVWGRLARERTITLAPESRRRTVAGTPRFEHALVGSPLGQTAVTPVAVLLHGSQCGWRGTQVEVIVDHDRSSRGPPLRGPVLGSFVRLTTAESALDDEAEFRRREPVPPPGEGLTDELIGRTARAMDSALAASFRSLDLHPPDDPRIEINTLADIDAADVMPFRPRPNAVRYAVSLRQRRITAGNDTVVASTVMAWDSAGVWQQFVFRPTLLSFRRGRLAPYGALRRNIFWRRLQPISDFGFQRDNLWMEQVDVRSGAILWGIVQPRGNVVVAAAEVEGPCR
jgi:hypothetical protein